MRRAHRPPRRAAGFTLLEMMVAVLIGGLSVLVAAKVASVVIRQSAKNQQSTDFNGRTRLLGRQLRNDLRLAGYGSTGAIAVDTGRAPWSLGMTIPINGKDAIAAVAGANNLGAGIVLGGTTLLPNSDAMMVAVPNPGLAGVTQAMAPEGAVTWVLDPPPSNPVLGALQPLSNCGTGFIYVVDHTAPNGAGRAQLMQLVSVVGDDVTTADQLQFNLAAGSSVVCARLSTYWVDIQGWLHRTDFGAAAAPARLGAGLVFVDTNQVDNDLIMPGVLDLQIAYRFSAELHRNTFGVLPPAAQLWRQWAYEGRVGNVDGIVTGSPGALEAWFETRMVRLNALLRVARQADPRRFGQTQKAGREDGNPTNVNRTFRAEWVTTTESLTNLRFFDHGTPAGVRPDPF